MNLTRYLVWRIAAARFGRLPMALGARERADAAAQAARERRVIRRALAAPEAAGIEIDAEVVRAKLAALAAEHSDSAAFRVALAAGGLDAEALAEAVAAELHAGLVLERIGDCAVVDEAEVHAFYAQRRDEMVLPERRLARHILVTIDEEREGRARVAAQMAQIMDALLSGADFATLALRHSECPTALEGGLVGEVRRGQLYPEVESALFAMGPGELRLAESPVGMHLIRCEAIIPAQPLGYQAAAPSIRRRLEAAARDQTLRRWLKENG